MVPSGTPNDMLGSKFFIKSPTSKKNNNKNDSLPT